MAKSVQRNSPSRAIDRGIVSNNGMTYENTKAARRRPLVASSEYFTARLPPPVAPGLQADNPEGNRAKWIDPPAPATTHGTKGKPRDLRRVRPRDQAGTMIRHTRFGPAQPLVALTYPVYPPGPGSVC